MELESANESLANDRLENCGDIVRLKAELQSKEDLLEKNKESKAVIQSESSIWPMCDMASDSIIELNLYLVPPNYLRCSV